MKNFALFLAAITLGIAAAPQIASAQATRTWVSGVGDDVNPCSRTAPCKTFAGAISKTAAGGEINCIDPGGFGGVTITKSISIICDGLEAGVLVSGTSGINVNAAATDIVLLSGLEIEGVGTGVNGVNILSAANVTIRNSLIHDFRAGANGGVGVYAAPGTNSLQLAIVNTQISGNGGATTGTGVLIVPTGATSVAVSVDHSQITGNGAGFRADSSGTSGKVQAVLRNSNLSHNTRAAVRIVGANTTLEVAGSTIGFNATGVHSDGGLVTLAGSQVFGNATGLFVGTGTITSYGNNQLDYNAANGPNPTSIAPR